MTTENMTPEQTRTSPFPLFALGFRPFYLAAAVFAVVALPLWLATWFGILQIDGYLVSVYWHSHEMVYGFTSAVIAGFLLTAVRNWTGQSTPTGASLGMLVALWMSARVFMLTGPAALAVIADLAFLPALAVTIAIPIWKSRNARNYKLLFVLAGLTAGNTLFHLAALGLLPADWFRSSTTIALDLITILMAVIGGRVIPAFTANAVSTAKPRQVYSLEVIAITSLILILAFGVVATTMPIPRFLWIALLTIAATAHAIRWTLWQPQRTLRNPLLWMLPVAYVWIPLSLGLRALAQLTIVPEAAAIHALTLGAIASLMVAMMMRSALGHTGRPLKAGYAETGAFVLLQMAAITRTIGTVVDPGVYRLALTLSGLMWFAAFSVFLLRYAPMLTRPRLDGRPG